MKQSLVLRCERLGRLLRKRVGSVSAVRGAAETLAVNRSAEACQAGLSRHSLLYRRRLPKNRRLQAYRWVPCRVGAKEEKNEQGER
jgi:hypothetical protein